MSWTPDKVGRQSSHRKDLCDQTIRPRTGQPGMEFLGRSRAAIGCRAIEEERKLGQCGVFLFDRDSRLRDPSPIALA
ncbi:hypothetical protein TNCV_2820201 [Trichonephila clavipes]|nr:hypothetical protein TNCV_2820201 [Trichonephila clavipes]